MKEIRKEYQGNIVAVVGGQYGDEAKGAVSSHLARLHNAPLVVKAGVGPNAEHGIFVQVEGKEHYLRVNQLPLGWILSPNAQIRVGRNVAVDPDKLLHEIGKYRLKDRVKIDSMCPIVSLEHVAAENTSKRFVEGIGSTLSGSGFARSAHILRTATLARDLDILHPFLTNVADEINRTAPTDTVIIEDSQGWGLNLSSIDYPNCTSKDVTSAGALADVGANPFYLKDVVLCVKTMPSREGQGSMGSSVEITTEQIKNRGLEEISSIKGKLRRKAESIDFEMLANACMENGATQIALTFCEHYDPKIDGVKNIDGVTKKIRKLIDQVEEKTNVPVTILNTGKPFDNFVYLPDKSVNLSSAGEEINFTSSYFNL
ncbi:MAG: adenylosuccinate synthetase [Candidatus Woesebacteria bacterium]|nr:adenylosuccinate synthetase [Candidatus Woesebacteria bacterium]